MSDDADRRHLRPDETRLVGAPEGAGPRGFDIEAIERINFLVDNVLREIARVDDGWTVVLQDPGDGRFWVRSMLEGYMHGGGYPELRAISAEEARGIIDLGTSQN